MSPRTWSTDTRTETPAPTPEPAAFLDGHAPELTPPPAVKNGRGRPSLYTDELALTICERIASGESLAKVCEDPDLPSRYTIFSWVKDRPGFAEMYDVAMRAKVDFLADKMIEIAATGDASLHVRTIQWRISKEMPSKYGDRPATERAFIPGDDAKLVNAPDETRPPLVIVENPLENLSAAWRAHREKQLKSA